ncbi:MAG: DUF4160 domain-containing protein [Acidobacteriota bacterium]
MPTVLRVGSYRFHFYSMNLESRHIFMLKTPDGECKFWMEPIRLAGNKGVSPRTIREIEKLVFEHQTLLKEKHDEYHKR